MVSRGVLHMAYDPLQFWFDEVEVPLSPAEGQIFEVLMRRGRATWDTLHEALSRRGIRRPDRDVLVYRLRRKFLRAGAPDPIRTVRGWGLQLRVEVADDRWGSLVIGARKPAF